MDTNLSVLLGVGVIGGLLLLVRALFSKQTTVTTLLKVLSSGKRSDVDLSEKLAKSKSKYDAEVEQIHAEAESKLNKLKKESAADANKTPASSVNSAIGSRNGKSTI